MKTPKDFDAFYNSAIIPSLHILDKERKRLVLLIIVLLLPSLAANCILIRCLTLFNYALIPLVVSICLSIFIILRLQKQHDQYNLHFKELVVGKLVGFISPQLIYNAAGNIKKEIFEASGLIAFDYDDIFKESDEVFGQTGKTRFSFLRISIKELPLVMDVYSIFLSLVMIIIAIGAIVLLVIAIMHFAYHTSSSSDLFGNGIIDSLETIPGFLVALIVGFLCAKNLFKRIRGFFNSKRKLHFNGIFFTADFNKKFQSKTFVFGNESTDLVAKYSIEGVPEIKLEDPHFARNFKVYANDEIEARYILSPVLMEGILKLQDQARSSICLSFAGASVFVAIPLGKAIFTAKLFSKAMDKTYLQQYLNYLQLTIGIVEELELNTRIWNKQ